MKCNFARNENIQSPRGVNSVLASVTCGPHEVAAIRWKWHMLWGFFFLILTMRELHELNVKLLNFFRLLNRLIVFQIWKRHVVTTWPLACCPDTVALKPPEIFSSKTFTSLNHTCHVLSRDFNSICFFSPLSSTSISSCFLVFTLMCSIHYLMAAFWFESKESKTKMCEWIYRTD